jgi:hypothetical protein
MDLTMKVKVCMYIYVRLDEILVYLLNGKVDIREGKPRRVNNIHIYMCIPNRRDPSIFT